MGITVIKKDGGSGGITADSTDTLTNKTIDGNNNTITNVGGGFWDTTVVQDNEQTVTNSTTLVDSDDLQVSLDASSDYLFSLHLVIDDNDNESVASSGIKFGMSYSGTSSADTLRHLELRNFDQIDRRFQRDFSDTTLQSGHGYPKGSVFTTQGYISTTTSGTLSVQFAQTSASAAGSAYLRLGSSLFVKKVS